MKRVLRLSLLATALLAAPAPAQRIVEYTETATGTDRLPLNFPVPMPVASLTPVEGFRDHASLHARLQSLALESDDLASHVVGATQGQGRPLHAYVVSDADGTDADGRAEAAFMINAAIHAREWAAPEVSVGLVERLVEGAGDRGIVRWLLDDTRLVIVPVLNVDGRLQTERYPNRAIVGRDPFEPSFWPRDGRMRRKNMRGADQNLESFGDHLAGIDVNRNQPPFWATSVTTGGSSSNPDTLIYHGQAAHSEAESVALRNAIALAPAARIRLGIDIHSFAATFFSISTGRPRLTAIQNTLLDRLTAHHQSVSASARLPSGIAYVNVPDPVNRGIGAVAEYFGYSFLVPAWTLELEPNGALGARMYGGFNPDGHSGFILPESEARRVREAWAETHLLAMYHMGGPPHLRRVRVLDGAGRVVVDREWAAAGNGLRALADRISQPLVAGRDYRAELVFSKPMRLRNARGNATLFSGVFFVPTAPGVALSIGGSAVEPRAGAWQVAGTTYRDDTWAFTFTAPGAGELALSVDAHDASGHALDADPSTPVDWQGGAWSGYEDASGTAGDVGGVDDSMAFAVAAAAPDVIAIGPVPAVAGEGDRLRIRLERAAPAAGVAAEATWGSCVGDAIQCDFVTFEGPVSWAEGEGGERFIEVQLPEDIEEGASRSGRLQVSTTVGSAAGSTVFAFDVVDNDGGVPVRRISNGEALRTALSADGGGLAVELVSDHGEYGLDTFETVELGGPLRLFGNHALFHIDSMDTDGAQLTIEDATVSGVTTASFAGIESAGTVIVRRSALNWGSTTIIPSPPPEPAFAVIDAGELVLDRSVVFTAGTGSVAISAAAASIASSTVLSDGGGSAIHGGDVSLSAAGSTFAAPTTTWSGTELQARASLAVDSLDVACAMPRLIGDGGSLFWLDGAGDWSASGCIAPAASDTVSSGDAAMLGSAPAWPERPYLLPAPNGPLVDAVPAAIGCPPIDQRGAPRPQTLVDGAEPLCDIGAIELGVNPYRGLWIPDRSGHGLDIHTAGNTLFITWFTYTDGGEPTAYLAAAPLTGPRWSARLFTARLPGGSFPIETFEVGDVEILFDSDVEARLRWRLDARGTWGEEGIRAHVFAIGEPRFETTGSWYTPAESGYGVVVTRRGAITGAVVYYYDRDGNMRWVLGSAGDGDVVDMPMLSFTGFCPDCDASTNPPVPQEAGRMRLHFLTPERVRVLSMDWSYPGSGGGLWRRENVDLVPLNSPVDNREAGALAESLFAR